jgi:hypothetical protein
MMRPPRRWAGLPSAMGIPSGGRASVRAGINEGLGRNLALAL